LTSLLLLLAFGIIGMGVGINALVKFHDQQHDLTKAAPAGSTVTVNANDVLDSGYNVTVVCGVLALLAALSLIPALAARFLRIVSFLIGFFTLWLFASLVAFTHFFATRSAKVTATLDGVPIPSSLVQTIVASLGATTQYKHIHYLRLSAILPWFTFLFGLTSAVLALIGSRKR
ncbi:hypothetical protein BC835DRAFT_1216869, partial [Cytidiella melzeri]